MTRHAPRLANSLIRKSSYSLNTNRIGNPWILNRHYTGEVGWQTRIPAYCTLSGPEPPMCVSNERRSPCYPLLQQQQQQSSYLNSMTMPRVKGRRTNVAIQERDPPIICTNPAITPSYETRGPPKLVDQISSAVNSGCSTSRTSSERPITPNSLSVADGIINPCGGYCRTFERCCHYVLQVIFIMGILSGVSLVLAAYYLHNQRKGSDQLVLVYIGVLMALVCTLLLSIQCGVEREVRRKKRNRRTNATLLARHRSHLEVPLREFGNNDGRMGCNVDNVHGTVPPEVSTFCQIPLLYQPCQYEWQSRSCDEMSQSQNGIPWWRRRDLEVTSKNDNII